MPAPRALHAIVYHAVQLLCWFQVLIKGNVACDTVHLNMPRIHKFFLSVVGINFSTYSYRQGAIGTACFVGEVEHGGRNKGRCTGLTSQPPVLSKVSRDWGFWGQPKAQSKPTVCDHHGTAAGDLYSPNERHTWLRVAQLHHSWNAALAGPGGRATA